MESFTIVPESPWRYQIEGARGVFTSRPHDCLTCCVRAALGDLETYGAESFSVFDAQGRERIGNVQTMSDYARDAYRRHNSPLFGQSHG